MFLLSVLPQLAILPPLTLELQGLTMGRDITELDVWHSCQKDNGCEMPTKKFKYEVTRWL